MEGMTVTIKLVSFDHTKDKCLVTSVTGVFVIYAHMCSWVYFWWNKFFFVETKAKILAERDKTFAEAAFKALDVDGDGRYCTWFPK